MHTGTVVYSYNYIFIHNHTMGHTCSLKCHVNNSLVRITSRKVKNRKDILPARDNSFSFHVNNLCHTSDNHIPYGNSTETTQDSRKVHENEVNQCIVHVRVLRYITTVI